MEFHLKKLKEYAIVVSILMCLLVSEAAGNSCAKAGVSWKDGTYYRQIRIRGEWIKINCGIRTSESVTLWFGKSRGETTKKLEVDDKNIKLVSKNVFNITNLTTEDHGWYTCEVCGMKHAKFVEVSNQGKAYAKPIVEKNPNKALYEIKDNVKLTCHAEGVTVAVYDIKWYKQRKNEKFKQLKTQGSYVNGMWTETLSLNGLSERDEGTYMCQIYRYPLQYSANELVDISVKDLLKPEIHWNNDNENIQREKGEDFLLSYNVQSYPASNIKWWRSKDRDGPYKLIAECPPTKECKKHLGEQTITKTSFEIKDLKYPDHQFFYKCNASNQVGKASKRFRLEVYAKPRVSLGNTHVHIYKKGKTINCTLSKDDRNPPNVNYTWFSCGTSKCDKQNLKLINESISLTLYHQTSPLMNYRCEAKNEAGSSTQDIEVVLVQSNQNCKDQSKAEEE